MSRLAFNVTPPKTTHPDLLFVNFNQDNSCISVGTRKGYSITNCNPYGKLYARNDGAISIVEMLFCTSLVALVGAGDRPNSSTRRLQIVNTKRQSTICELTFPTSILSVKLNRKRLVVVLEEQIYIYDISNLKLLHTIETSPNPSAICALSPSNENSYLAYPSPSPSPSTPFPAPPSGSSPNPSSGDVLIFDSITLSVTNIIQAHKTPVAALAINPQGTLLATASDKGTVIRVFSVPNGDKVAQFRRGSYPTRIWSLGFNSVSSLLCVSSDTETVHIFKLNKGGPSTGNGGKPGRLGRSESDFGGDDDGSSIGSRFSSRESSSSIGGYEAFIDSKRNSNGGVAGSLRRKSTQLTRNLAGSVGGYLPNTLTEMWDPQRDFAFLKLPTSGVRSVVALSSTTPQVMVVTSEGIFYSYNIDLENGGECVLQKSYSLMEGIDESNGSLMQD